MGRPIITSDAPGCRETVRDAETLALKMEYFIRNQSVIEKMGEQSHKIVERKYDVHKVKQSIIKHFVNE